MKRKTHPNVRVLAQTVCFEIEKAHDKAGVHAPVFYRLPALPMLVAGAALLIAAFVVAGAR